MANDGDLLERLRWQMVLLGVVLAPHACLDEVSGIGEGGWLVEAMPKGFSHEGPWRRVVPRNASEDVEEQLPPFFQGDAP